MEVATSQTPLTACQSILKDLFETQEFQDGQIDSRVEAKTAFVGAQRRVKLHTVSTIDLDLALVIFPDNSELDDTLRNRSDLESLFIFRVLLEEGGVFESRNQFYPRSVIRFLREADSVAPLPL